MSSASYYERNREAIKAKQRLRGKVYYATVLKAHRATPAEREKHRLRLLARYWRDPERARAEAQRRKKADPDRRNATARAWHHKRMLTDPESYRAVVRQRAAIEKGAEGQCSAADWTRVVETYGNACLACGLPKKLTQDHVVPLSRGGTHWPVNLQPLCLSCNASKGARNQADYRPDAGRSIQEWGHGTMTGSVKTKWELGAGDW